jgi:ABC-type xylose transport system permease subunit
MKMSRAIPLTVAYMLGVVGGIALIQSSRWGMYIVTVSYTTVLVTVVLGAWSTMLGIEQRLGEAEQREKAGR